MKNAHLLTIAFIASVLPACSSSEVTGDEQNDTEIEVTYESCSFDPSLGQANPFGMRRYVSLHETEDGVVARLENFPSNAGNGSVPATVSEVRELLLFGQSMGEARKTLAEQDSLYWELIQCGEYCGSDPSDQFETLDALLSCTTSDVASEPYDGREFPSTCGYDATITEAPNPLGMRTFLTIGLDPVDSSAVQFTVEYLPSNVGVGDLPATLASRTDLLVYSTSGISEARQLVADSSTGLADALLLSPTYKLDPGAGEDAAATYSEVDAALTCQ